MKWILDILPGWPRGRRPRARQPDYSPQRRLSGAVSSERRRPAVPQLPVEQPGPGLAVQPELELAVRLALGPPQLRLPREGEQK